MVTIASKNATTKQIPIFNSTLRIVKPKAFKLETVIILGKALKIAPNDG